MCGGLVLWLQKLQKVTVFQSSHRAKPATKTENMDDWDSLQVEYEKLLQRVAVIPPPKRTLYPRQPNAAPNAVPTIRLKLAQFQQKKNKKTNNTATTFIPHTPTATTVIPHTSHSLPAPSLLPFPCLPHPAAPVQVDVAKHQTSRDRQQLVQAAANKWRTVASRDRLQSLAVQQLTTALHTLAWTTDEQVPTIESIHELVVTSAELEWSASICSAHIIAQEEALPNELSASYNQHVKVPDVDFSDTEKNNWAMLANTIRCLRSSTQILAEVLMSPSGDKVSPSLIHSIMYQMLQTDDQRELLLAEVCRLTRKQTATTAAAPSPTPLPLPPPTSTLTKLLTAVARSPTSQHYVRHLFQAVLTQMYKNIDQSIDKKPTSRATQQSGTGVEQTVHRLLHAILSSSHPLPSLLCSACCILSDAGFDASDFLLGSLICDSIRETLYLPFVSMVHCVETKKYTNDAVSGAQNTKEHLHQVAFVLERVFSVTPSTTNTNMEPNSVAVNFSVANIAHQFGPPIADYVQYMLYNAALTFKEHATHTRVYENQPKCGVHIRESDLLELCTAFVSSNVIQSNAEYEQLLETMRHNLLQHHSRNILCIPMVSADLNMQWGEMVSLKDLEVKLTWSNAAQQLSRLKYVMQQCHHLIAVSKGNNYLTDVQLTHIQEMGIELVQNFEVFCESFSSTIQHVHKRIVTHRHMHVLLQKQSSGMLLRQRSSTNLDDGLLPMYRLLKPTDHTLPTERESTVYLASAGVECSTDGDPLNVRRTKYLRGAAMNDCLHIEDRPHSWRSPVARTRMRSIVEANEHTIMKECTFQPNLKRHVAEKGTFIERPAWNQTQITGR